MNGWGESAAGGTDCLRKVLLEERAVGRFERLGVSK